MKDDKIGGEVYGVIYHISNTRNYINCDRRNVLHALEEKFN